MKQNKIILFAILMLFAACTTKPDEVIPSRKMTRVLVDLHKAEGAIQNLGYNYGHDETVRQLYVATLEHHNVTQAQFDSSLVWYTDHPKIFNRIYMRVVTTIDEEYKLCAEANGTDLIAASIRNMQFSATDTIICPLFTPIYFDYEQKNQHVIDSINSFIPYIIFSFETDFNENMQDTTTTNPEIEQLPISTDVRKEPDTNEKKFTTFSVAKQ